MPFEKPTNVGSERGGMRALCLAAVIITASLLLLRVGVREAPPEEAGALSAVVENDAVRAFLQLDEVD